MRINKLSLNYKKTTFMLIKCDTKPVTSFLVDIGSNQIAHTNCTKYLGVILDQRSVTGVHAHGAPKYAWGVPLRKGSQRCITNLSH